MSNKKVVHLQPARKPAKKEVWVDAVGAGNWIAGVGRIEEGENRGAYRFSVARVEPGSRGKLSRDFQAEDVLSLPKLTQVLAATLVADGWLDPGLREDLKCLADSLDSFLSLREPGMGCEWVVVRRESLQVVLKHVLESEIENFRNLSVDDRRRHVFRAAVDLRGKLTGSDRFGDDLAGPEGGAEMHV